VIMRSPLDGKQAMKLAESVAKQREKFLEKL
jgi:hypothetical protein